MRRAFWIGFFSLASCAEAPIDRSIEIPPGGAALVVVHDGSEVIGASLIFAGQSVALAQPASAKRSLWVLDPQDFLGSGGRPLQPQMIAGLSLHLAGSEDAPRGSAESCRRCLVPDDGLRPHVVHAGTVCPPPAFSEVVSEDFVAAGEIVRAKLWLEWPGGCECREPSLQLLSPPFDASFLLPENVSEAETEPYFALARAPDGSIAIFDRERATLLAPDGSSGRSVRTNFKNHPVIVEALPNGSFFVFEHLVGTTELDFRAWRFSPELEAQQLPFNPPEPFFPRGVSVQPNGSLLLTGGRLRFPINPSGATAICEADTLACKVLITVDSPNSYTHRETARLDNGILAGFGDDHFFAVGSVPAPSSLLRSDPPLGRLSPNMPWMDGRLILDGGGDVPWAAVYRAPLDGAFDRWKVSTAQRTISAGNRLFACAELTDDEHYRLAILSRELDASYFSPAEVARRSEDGRHWRPAYCSRYATCLGFERTGGEVHAYIEDHRGAGVVRLDAATGALLSNLSDPLSCETEQREPFVLERRLRRVYQTGTEPPLFETRDRALYVRDGAGFRRIFGPSFASSPIGGAVSLPEGVFGFGGRGRVTFVPRGEETWRDLDPLDSPLWGQDLSWIGGAAVIGAEGRETLIAGVIERNGVISGWLQRVSPAVDGTRVIGEPVELRAGDRAYLPVDLAAVAPGVAVIAAHPSDAREFEAPVLLRYRDGVVQAIEMDPSQPAPPDAAFCRPRLATARFPLSGYTSSHGLRGVDGGLGYAWATGCDSALFLVHALADPPHAKYFDGRTLLELGSNIHFYTPAMRCPDDVVMVAAGDTIDTSEGQFFSIGPRRDLSLPMKNLQTPVGDRSATVYPGGPFELLHDRGRMIAVYGATFQDEAGGTVLLIGGDRTIRTRDAFSAAVFDGERAVIFGESPRITTISPE